MNRDEFRSKYIKKGMKLKEVATKLDISPTSLSYKLNGKRNFKQSEIIQCIKVLELNNEDVQKIFFE